MKQGQQARGGSRRQEVEKTWRRRRLGRGRPGQWMPLSRVGKTLKGKKPHGRSRHRWRRLRLELEMAAAR
jgi:hypothetical protein